MSVTSVLINLTEIDFVDDSAGKFRVSKEAAREEK